MSFKEDYLKSLAQEAGIPNAPIIRPKKSIISAPGKSIFSPTPDSSKKPAAKSIFSPPPGSSKKPIQTTNYSGNYSYGDPSIKDMQVSIKDFGKTINTATKDFNDFLAEQYSAGSSVRGKEWTTDPTAVNKEQKKPVDYIELHKVLNSLDRTGSPLNETGPDGVWNFRTQNAVKNVCAIADALVRASEDFQSKLPASFTRSDLEQLKKATPLISKRQERNNYLTTIQPQLAKNAEVIADLVDKLADFYESFYKNIIIHPAYKSYINKSNTLIAVNSVKEKDENVLSKEQEKQMQNLANYRLVNVPIISADKGVKLIKELSLGYIRDLNSLQQLMVNSLGYSQEQALDKNNQKAVLDSILNNVNYYLDKSVQIKRTQLPTPSEEKNQSAKIKDEF